MHIATHIFRRVQAVLVLSTLVVIAHAVTYQPSDPFYNGDEQRHLMSSVFFHDLMRNIPTDGIREFATAYYLQYPALGLLVWPPLFYFLSGVIMLFLGPSMLIAKGSVVASAVLAVLYLFWLVSRTHNSRTGFLAAVMFAFLPMIFALSRQVMLEMPTLAACLGCTFHLVRYFDDRRIRDLVGTALFAAAALLIRYDAFVLFPLIFLIALLRGQTRLLISKPVIIAIVFVAIAVGPYHLFAGSQWGGAALKFVNVSSTPASGGFLSPRNFLFYPGCLPNQIGYVALAFALAGIVGSLVEVRRHESRVALAPFLGLVLATYLAFSPLAELVSRHAIYWVPAFAFFALDGCQRLGRLLRVPGASLLLSLGVIAAIAVSSLAKPAPYVLGSRDAARYVADNTQESKFCLYDAYLDGSFIYHLSRMDTERRLWVLRGNKILYNAIGGDPNIGYAEFASNETDLLRILHQYDPEFIVVEEPCVTCFPPAMLLRKSLQEHPELFRLEKTFPLDTNAAKFAGTELLVYRKLVRNPTPVTRLRLPMLILNRDLETNISTPPLRPSDPPEVNR